MISRRSALVLLFGAAACGRRAPEMVTRREAGPGAPAAIGSLIDKYAAEYAVPAPLIHSVVKSESSYNPAARNGPYWGLMQLLPQTAASMGHVGPPQDLLDPDVNLRFGVKYLRGAWLVADGNYSQAIGWYRRGYYYEAKRKGLLREAGLRI